MHGINSYLDLLKTDNLEYILNIVANDIENNIIKIAKKINKLNSKLKPLCITYYHEHEYTDIFYINVSYCIPKYLFGSLNVSNAVFINIYNDLHAQEYGKTFVSKIFNNPTYFDILIEANKSIVVTSNYDHKFLEGIQHIPRNKVFIYSGVRPKKNVKYFELLMTS
jgi:hypothetical protein